MNKEEKRETFFLISTKSFIRIHFNEVMVKYF